MRCFSSRRAPPACSPSSQVSADDSPRGSQAARCSKSAASSPGSRVSVSPHLAQATFTSGQITEVEVRLEPVGNETRLTVEHRGWETVPQEHVARHGFPDAMFLRRHAEWWQVLLANVQYRSRVS
jgi:hypothetical protein